MSKLPVISGEKAVKCFEKLGYEVVGKKELIFVCGTNLIEAKSL